MTVVRRKYKMSRRLGSSLWGRPKDPVNKRNYPPGQHGKTTGRRKSDFAKQSEAHQGFKWYYLVGEKQFVRIFKAAHKIKGNAVDNLVGLLESRLSTVLYNSGLVPTIYSASHVVAHKHLTVNGKVVNKKGYKVQVGDVIEIRERAKNLPLVTAAIDGKERDIPEYLEVNVNTRTMKLIRVPKFAEVPYPVQMQPHLVSEFYSR